MFSRLIGRLYSSFFPRQTANVPETRSETIPSSTLDADDTVHKSCSCASEYESESELDHHHSLQTKEISDSESHDDLTREKAVYCDPATGGCLEIEYALPADNESNAISLVTAMPETTASEGEIAHMLITKIEPGKISSTCKPISLCTETSVSAESETSDVDGLSEIVTRYERYASLLPSVTLKVVDISPTSMHNAVATFFDHGDVTDVEIIETQFQVSMSPSVNHATRTSDEPSAAINIDTFRSFESDDLESHGNLVKSAWIIRAVEALRDAGFDDSDECTIEIAKDIVLKDNRPEFNVVPCEFVPLEVVYRKYIFTHVKFYQCLLVSAPHSEQEVQRRNEEMENFMRNTFPLTQQDSIGSVFKQVVVMSDIDILNAIHNFFYDMEGVRGKNALHALIVFFGHGNKDGRFTMKSMHEGMLLDDITKFVKEKWRQAIRYKPEELPAKVEIIFSQCYGNLHDASIECDRFKVVALSRKHYPLTLSVKDLEGRYYITKLIIKANYMLRPQYERLRDMRAEQTDVGEATAETSYQPDSGIVELWN